MKQVSGPSQPVKSGRALLKGVVGDKWAAVALLAGVSFAGAVLEAGFLVLVTAVSFALINSGESVGPYLGTTLSISTALGVAAAALVVRLAFNLLSTNLATRLTADVTLKQRAKLAHAYLAAQWSVQQNEPSGRLQELLTTFVSRITWAINTLTASITSALGLVAFLGTGLFVDAKATSAVLLALGLVATILIPIRRRLRRLASSSSAANLEFANAIAELGTLGLEMHAFGVQNEFAQRIDLLNARTAERQRRVDFLNATMAPVYLTLAYASILAGVSTLAFLGLKDLSVIGAVMLLMLRSISYGQQLASASGSLAASLPFLEQVSQTVAKYSALAAPKGARAPAAATPLRATGMSFSYPSQNVDALNDLNFEIHSGEAIGIIGPSGSGKSTLAKVLLDLQYPTSGEIRAAGVSLAEIDRDWWRRRAAYVPQDAQLLTGTVAENVRFFRANISDRDIEVALELANVLTDIEALGEGLASHLGERGARLSGGQRQRVSIARALAGQPELLILDEPTSSLDVVSEMFIRETLSRLHGRVTVVLVAHRMSTLDACDRIMVIERGRISAVSTPQELRQSNEFYRAALGMTDGAPQ